MPGIKRRVDSAEDRDGKRTKVKDAAASAAKNRTKQYVPPAFQKKGITRGARKMNRDKKLRKTSTKKATLKKGPKGLAAEDEEDDNQESDSDIPTSEESDIEMEIKDEIEEEEEEEANDDSSPSDDQPEFKGKDSNGSGEADKQNASRESHAKQKALAQERKAAKPNADIIARSKKLWERLRRKSHVPRDERKTLVAELYEIINGRVSDFVFKHDSVRVIQTALKYANLEQRKLIARELQGQYKDLAESRYAKFLLGKLLVHGDAEIRDMIIPEFYGHVKRLIRHPEASWILDDIYRTVATRKQKSNLLREWYGAEFAIFKDNKDSGMPEDLAQILAESPEKRPPIMRHLYELINQLVQKKTTGFTILHDAMLQYFLNTKPGSSDANEFIELIKGDEEGDLAKNMAFTQSGARLTCLCLAYSSAKDRKLLLRFYRDTIKLMAGDVHAHMVLLTAFEVIDDTRLTTRSIFPELLSQDAAESTRYEDLLMQINDLNARIPILYLFAGDKVKWLLPAQDEEIMKQVLDTRTETSKKDPSIRRQELIKAASPTLLEFIAAQAESLMETSFGCQFISEVLFSAEGGKDAALSAIAVAAQSKAEAQDSPFVGRMLKSLVQGGRFNSAEKKIEKVEPALGFDTVLYDNIRNDIMAWATGSQTYVVVALAESDEFVKKDELLQILKKNKKALEKVATGPGASSEQSKKAGPASSGAKLLLTKI
ncbi:armadillo-type protein [Talaromyces proteolyticus]|uniref:Armadillo-type protein n=1 Tax=Talaromyces proteolyticus TaxID=1131652 RepID=A0AAD4KIG3_9EURO|nr:armadillo-type protein [Talaromyces proteolyticus]KAH8693172.1 armadillo-type protein [Talaromyces proteolyticus]